MTKPSKNYDSITTEELNTTVKYARNFDGADGWSKIQNALDDLGGSPGTVIVNGDNPDHDSGFWEGDDKVLVPDDTVLKVTDGAHIRRKSSSSDHIPIANDGAPGASASSTTANANVHIFIGKGCHVDGRAAEFSQQHGTSGFQTQAANIGLAHCNNCSITVRGEIHDAVRHGIETVAVENITIDLRGGEIYNCSDDSTSHTDSDDAVFTGPGSATSDTIDVYGGSHHDIANYGSMGGSAGPEAEDGVSNVTFYGVTAKDNAYPKIHQHSGEDAPSDIRFIGGQLGGVEVDHDVDGLTFDHVDYSDAVQCPLDTSDTSRWPTGVEFNNCTFDSSPPFAIEGLPNEAIRVNGGVVKGNWTTNSGKVEHTKFNDVKFDMPAGVDLRPHHTSPFTDCDFLWPGQNGQIELRVSGGQYEFKDCYVNGAENGLSVFNGNADALLVDGLVTENLAFNHIAINPQDNTLDELIVRNTESKGSDPLSVDDSTQTVSLARFERNKDVDYQVSASRAIYDGTEFASSTPSASTYSDEDAGIEVVDLSTTEPYDSYRVREDGTLAQTS